MDHPVYPASWSPLKASIGANCSELSGTYGAQRIGTDVAPWALAAQLYRLTDPKPGDPFLAGIRQYTAIRLEVMPPSVRVTFIAAGEAVRVVDVGAPDHSCSCDGHGLALGRSIAEAALFAVAAGREQMVLYKALDGSLITRTGYSEAGTVFLVVPIGGSSYVWERYAAAPGP